jgi:PilZ domain
MMEATKSPKGSDWTRLLTDPDLVSHLGKLLQTYREVAPELREQALLGAMREIKEAAVAARQVGSNISAQVPPPPNALLQGPQPVDQIPPFEPEFFSEVESDRRRFQRIKCHVAVEINVEGINEPIWGNLVNVSRGGCLVETASAVPPGKALEIGLWLANDKVWVKGMILSGVAAARTAQSYGVRVKFSEAELSQKEHLREFLKFVDSTARKAQSGKAYVAQLKR